MKPDKNGSKIKLPIWIVYLVVPVLGFAGGWGGVQYKITDMGSDTVKIEREVDHLHESKLDTTDFEKWCDNHMKQYEKFDERQLELVKLMERVITKQEEMAKDIDKMANGK